MITRKLLSTLVAGAALAALTSGASAQITGYNPYGGFGYPYLNMGGYEAMGGYAGGYGVPFGYGAPLGFGIPYVSDTYGQAPIFGFGGFGSPVAGYGLPYLSVGGWGTPFVLNNGMVQPLHAPNAGFGIDAAPARFPSLEERTRQETGKSPENGEAKSNGNEEAKTTEPDRVLPRSSDAIEVQRETNNRMRIVWSGDTSLVSRITFSLLDANRQPILRRTITRLPAEARFARSSSAAYYQVVIEYVNGTTRTLTSAL
jgi:hypothetical protein